MSSYPTRDIGTLRTLTVPVSFETGEQGTLDLPSLPFRFRINAAYLGVTKAIAATDAGTVTLGKGATVLSTLTVPLSSALNAQVSDTAPTPTAFELTDKLRVISAKTTAGGKALVTLFVEVLPSH